ncbi:MAG: undecaprenyl-phosphate glucose phosphotransferase, partial [Lachnospiraceae bacterium]|nr:undecaprenyl-phosphate glucose phosphotransferase [Lachnospiraceae bacterium]
MIKENQKHLNQLAVILDAVVSIGAYVVAYALVFRYQIFSSYTGPVEAVYSFAQYMSALYFLVPA